MKSIIGEAALAGVGFSPPLAGLVVRPDRISLEDRLDRNTSCRRTKIDSLLRNARYKISRSTCLVWGILVLALWPHHTVRAAPPPAPAPLTFSVGDQLHVSFYEPFNSDAKWAALGQVREPGPSFYLHDELSGVYTVASDWTIALPILGDVVVAHRTAAEVEQILGQDFVRAVGHPGFVNISIAARRPLYVLGVVNKPGVYPFAPDMTPLELVALAGGYRSASLDAGASVEAVQASANQAATLDRLRNDLAQLSVLQAKINGAPAQVPQQLVGLVGEAAADVLVQEALASRQALVDSQAMQAKALQSAVDAAQMTLATDQARLQPTKDGVALLLARLSSLKTLSKDGLAEQQQIEAAQGAALESQERRQDVLAAIAGDQHQLVLAKLAVAGFISNTQVVLNQQMADLQREIANLTPQVTASAEVIRMLTSQDAPQDNSIMQFSIVRDGELIAAGITTGLQPGDVLQVETMPVAPPGDYPIQQSAATACPRLGGCS